MIILTFPARFAAAIRTGVKSHTVRSARKIPVKIGDALSLRQWTGESFRSPQVIIGACTCTRLTLLRLRLVDRARPGSHWGVDRHLAIDCLRHTTATGDAITVAESAACTAKPVDHPGVRLDDAAADDVARRDGYDDLADLTRTLRAEHGRDLDHGVISILIGWDGPLPL